MRDGVSKENQLRCIHENHIGEWVYDIHGTVLIWTSQKQFRGDYERDNYIAWYQDTSLKAEWAKSGK